jgi:hypothetical protein
MLKLNQNIDLPFYECFETIPKKEWFKLVLKWYLPIEIKVWEKFITILWKDLFK